jgi:two-component system, cell cycle sensor histidine kinase and response regulator CckA
MTADWQALSPSRSPQPEPVCILHLEDSPLDAELTAQYLARGGICAHLERVSTRAEFLTALERRKFDLILADYALPGFDGLAALDLVRQRDPDIPFIVVSGRMGEEVAVDTLKHGATDYVLKTRLDRLAPAVRRATAEVREREERRRAERALRETEERFRILADAAPVMIWMAGPDNGIEYLSRHWEAFTGRTAHSDLGYGWTQNVHPEDLERVLEAYQAAFASRESLTMEYRIRHKDGEYRWVVSNSVPRLGPEGEFLGYIGSCVDITELKRTEEKLRHAAKLESLGVLAGGIAHDFNNLLTGIIGNACLLQEQLAYDPDSAQLVENILQASDTATRLTRQILAYSGKGQFVVERLDLSRQAQGIASLLEASIPKNVSLVLDLAAGLPPIEGDSGQIHQVIMNLVINAAEATAPNPGKVRVATYLEDSGEKSRVVLEVRDWGHGMDEDTCSRIFDPFFTTKFTGRGLGLAAVSGIVRSHKAEIRVDSSIGEGTTFQVFFPAAMGAAPRRRQETPALKKGSGTVLVVDDEEIVRRIATLALQRSGYTVLTAANGREAIETLSLNPQVDVLVLDLMMPVMSGWEALEHLRRIKPNVKVVASSGYTEAEAMRRFGSGISVFVQKPYRSQVLVQKIQQLLTPNAETPSKPATSNL